MIPFSLAAMMMIPTTAPAQTPGDKMIEAYLAAQTDKLSQKFLDGAKTLEEWQKKRPRLYQEYMDMLGLWPLPEKTPLKATVTGKVEAHGVIVEKLHYQSKPGLYVTGNLYRPGERSQGKYPAILYVCGHSGRGRDGNKTAFQDHGFWFANNGYVCLIVDTLQLGEIPGVHHGTYGRPWGHLKSWGETDAEKMKNHNRFWWHSLGYSPAAVECWNGVRGIDYLLTRPEVDPERIGVTGISGGGAATFWVACADERVKVAVPVSGMSDLEFYVKDKGVNGHCDCMFLYNTYQWDWTTIAALIAPRPMLFANSDKDPIFPMDANRRIIAKLRQLYKMYDKSELVDEYVSVGGHDYRPDLRVAIFKFFNQHLKGDAKAAVEDSEKYKPLPGKELRVFAEDKDLPKDVINHRIDETFVERGKAGLPEEGKFEEWKKSLVAELQRRVFNAWSFPVAPAKRVKNEDKTYRVVTEAGVTLDDALGVHAKEPYGSHALIVAGKTDEAAIAWAKNNLVGLVELLRVRGYGDAAYAEKSPPNYVERSHLLLGRTVDEGRLHDVLAQVRSGAVQDKSKNGTTLIGSGQSGILAAYAALFEPSIKEVVIIDPPKSHMEGPHFLNVLRVLDIPEALGLLAPRQLTIIGGKDAAFDRTEEIYRRAGAAGKLVRK